MSSLVNSSLAVRFCARFDLDLFAWPISGVALPAPLPGSLESIGVFIFWVPQSYDPRDSLLRAKPPRTHARGEKPHLVRSPGLRQ